PKTNDNEYTPTSDKKWTKERYDDKIAKLSLVIAKLNDEYAPDIIGLCEVENKTVLERITKNALLEYKLYKYIHFDSPDQRGIDVALMYKSTRFKPYFSKVHKVTVEGVATRDILHVSGVLSSSDTLQVLVTHFPSRYGGKQKTISKRKLAATKLRNIIDDILAKSPRAKIAVMGDFNDEPFDLNIWETLNARPHSFDLSPTQLFNPMGVLAHEGKGSYRYRDEWNMLDQIMLSRSLADQSAKLHYKVNSVGVYDEDFLKQKDDPKYADYPFRTYVGTKYLGGYSDHFPVYLKLVVKK
ncbi:MAG: hypothetical protein AAF734_10860, partial [Bacteroidota bacterium]